MAKRPEENDSGSLIAYLRRKAVDYTGPEKPAPAKEKMAKKPERERPTTVKARTEKPVRPKEENPIQALRETSERTAEAGHPAMKTVSKDDAPQPYGDDRSVFARTSRDVLNRLPQPGSVMDVLKAAKAKKRDKGRDREK